jgi:hypothetical protein
MIRRPNAQKIERMERWWLRDRDREVRAIFIRITSGLVLEREIQS